MGQARGGPPARPRDRPAPGSSPRRSSEEGALCPQPLFQVPQPWFLVSLAPGRSCGSAVKSHILSSVGIPETHTHAHTHTRAHTHACPGMHTVPSQVQSPLLVTPSPALAPRCNMSPPCGPGARRQGGRCRRWHYCQHNRFSPGCWGGRRAGFPTRGPLRPPSLPCPGLSGRPLL